MLHAGQASGRPPEPVWLATWRGSGIATTAALRRFDSLPGLPLGAMLGCWRGLGLATGHPLDGVLEALGWHGKRFSGADDVQPLLFTCSSGPPLALEPALMPVSLALRWPGLSRARLVRWGFVAARPLLRARRSGARLRLRRCRGKTSAAMIYRSLPITDHFRAIDAERVLGMMEIADGTKPYFFLLERDHASA